jgi:carbonic anhydrase
MGAIERLLQANAEHARSFRHAGLPALPAHKLAVVLCMDARINPVTAFGLAEGDAHIMRNGGGRVKDAIRSLVLSQALGTDAVAIIHHTECGTVTYSEAEVREKIREASGMEPEGIDLQLSTSLEASLREDLALYRATPLLRQDIPVRGFIYDVRTGLLTEVA